MTNPTSSRSHLTPTDRAVLKVLLGMLVFTVIINILRWFGYSLISGEIYLMLPVTIFVAALAWGVFVLLRHIQTKWLRFAMTALAAIALFLGVAVFMSYGGFVVSLTIPQKFNTVTSPSGKNTAVVLRILDGDEARIQARFEARRAADPDSPEDIAAQDFGYRYSAYPVAFKFFYRSNADVTGEITMGYDAPSTLMAEWSDDESAVHFFVDDPGPVDGGDVTVRFDR